MKRNSGIYIFIIVLIISNPVTPCFGQNNKVDWYSFNSGYGLLSTASMQVNSIIGQQFIGQTGDGGTKIQSGFISGIQIKIGVSDELRHIPFDYSLNQNYPNPFNPATTIKYTLSQSGDVSLMVYNLRGQEVALIFKGNMPAGNHQVTWDASNFASGIYFYRLQAGDFVQTRKMVLLK